MKEDGTHKNQDNFSANQQNYVKEVTELFCFEIALTLKQIMYILTRVLPIEART